MQLIHALFVLSVALLVPASPLEKRSTPPFYLVSTSNKPSLNLKPVLLGASGVLSLTTGSLTTFHLNDNNGLSVGSGSDVAAINFPEGTSCGTEGQVIRLSGSTTNKCAATSGFELQSDTLNSQLGAQLVYDFTGGFYSCDGKIEYSAKSTPSGCAAVQLWTVPSA